MLCLAIRVERYLILGHYKFKRIARPFACPVSEGYATPTFEDEAFVLDQEFLAAFEPDTGPVGTLVGQDATLRADTDVCMNPGSKVVRDNDIAARISAKNSYRVRVVEFESFLAQAQKQAAVRRTLGEECGCRRQNTKRERLLPVEREGRDICGRAANGCADLLHRRAKGCKHLFGHNNLVFGGDKCQPAGSIESGAPSLVTTFRNSFAGQELPGGLSVSVGNGSVDADLQAEPAARNLRQASAAALHFTASTDRSGGGVKGDQQAFIATADQGSVKSMGNPLHTVQTSNHGLPCHGFVQFRVRAVRAMQCCTNYVSDMSLVH